MKKYLDNPNPQRPTLIRASKIDPFKADIERMLEADPTVSAMVIRQRLQERAFDGGITIVRDDLYHRSQDFHIFARHSRSNNVCYSLGLKSPRMQVDLTSSIWISVR